MLPQSRLPAPPDLTDDAALFLDFDGTLVEIAPAPELVEPPPGLGRLLDRLAGRLDGALAIVSGRPVEALRRNLIPFAGLLIGQHGMERREADGRIVDVPPPPGLEPIRQSLAAFVERHPGLRLEDKGGTLSLHYRQAPELALACRREIRRAVIASCGRFRAIDGHMLVELVPSVAGKAQAIAALLDAPPFLGRRPVFIGDDTGDEPGFELVNRLGGISVKIGDGATAARHRLPGPAAVLAWLGRAAGEPRQPEAAAASARRCW
jgi:trehalose 6-phosphate phosphatase